MPSCSFCAYELSKGSGLLFVKKDGTLYYFCSGKCRKNLLKLGREGRHHKWTHAFRSFMGKAESKPKAVQAEPVVSRRG